MLPTEILVRMTHLPGTSRGPIRAGQRRHGPLSSGPTVFFDRVVTGAMERHVTQVLNVGAGYDGRALRYAKPGVAWWEVDHPHTQADKRNRLERLGIDTAHVCFVGHDLRHPGLGPALIAAGHQPDAASIVICEGVAVYLDLPVFESVLAELRSLATVGTRLAMSLSPPLFTGTSGSPEALRGGRRRSRAAEELPQPGRSGKRARRYSVADRDAISEGHRRRLRDDCPVMGPGFENRTATIGVVGKFMDSMLHRSGPATTRIAHRIDLWKSGEADEADRPWRTPREFVDGARWIARVFPCTRDPEAVPATPKCSTGWHRSRSGRSVRRPPARLGPQR